jgi:hypothetical protein
MRFVAVATVGTIGLKSAIQKGDCAPICQSAASGAPPFTTRIKAAGCRRDSESATTEAAGGRIIGEKTIYQGKGAQIVNAGSHGPAARISVACVVTAKPTIGSAVGDDTIG